MSIEEDHDFSEFEDERKEEVHGLFHGNHNILSTF